MKIRKMGWTTFVLSTDNISVATDPIYDGKSINGKVEADVILLTNYEKDVKKGIIIDNSTYMKVRDLEKAKYIIGYKQGEVTINHP